VPTIRLTSQAQVSTWKTVSSTFRTISIKDAHCSSEADKEKILAIVESSFSSVKAFDRHISKLLTEVIPITALATTQHRGLASSVHSHSWGVEARPSHNLELMLASGMCMCRCSSPSQVVHHHRPSMFFRGGRANSNNSKRHHSNEGLSSKKQIFRTESMQLGTPQPMPQPCRSQSDSSVGAAVGVGTLRLSNSNSAVVV
jgi:hypothetical protein